MDDAAGGGSAQDGSGPGSLPNDLATQPVVSDPLGDICDDTGTSQTTQSATTDEPLEMRPSTVDPGLRGAVVAEESVPGFGIDQGRAQPRAWKVPMVGRF